MKGLLRMFIGFRVVQYGVRGRWAGRFYMKPQTVHHNSSGPTFSNEMEAIEWQNKETARLTYLGYKIIKIGYERIGVV